VARTVIRSLQLKDGDGVNIDDLDITTSGKSVIAKIAVGNGLTIVTSTGADSGTGVVTLKVSDALSIVTSLTSPLVYGSASSGGTLTLGSTSHATKGKILFGTSAYDEVNNRMGIGTASPTVPLDVLGGGIRIDRTSNDSFFIFSRDGTNNAQLRSGSGYIKVTDGAGTTEYARFQISTGHFLLGSTTDSAVLYVVQPAYTTTGHYKALKVDGGAHTNLTASTEAIAIDIALNRTVQFATGALTLQRDVVFRAPTYGFVGASTISDSATVSITGAPITGTNATQTRAWALLIQGTSTSLARLGVQAASGDGTIAISADGSSSYLSQLLFQDLNTTKYTIRYDGSATDVGHIAAAGLNIGFLVTSGASLNLTGAGNIGLWGSVFGTSAVKVLALTGTTGTLPSVEPTTSPADVIQIWAKDGATGACELYIRNEAGRVKRLTGDFCSVTSDVSKTSNTTMSDITGLTFNLEAGKTYSFEANIYLNIGNVVSGWKIGMAAASGLTVTTFWANVFFVDDNSARDFMYTSIGTFSTMATTVNTDQLVRIRGTIVVNAAGVLSVQFAQNSSNASALKAKTGSYFKLIS
jgi:hypothetical protein